MHKNEFTRLALLALMIFLSIPAFSQKIQIRGNVIDDQLQEPLMGVTIKEKGTSNGVISDIDGNFTITADAKGSLVFSYMGYSDQEVAIGNRKQIDVTLVTESKLLDELVVIGYGVQKKSDITGSISSIAGKDINNQPVSSTLQALQGRAAGVNIIQNTGAPGSGTTIKVRGTGTVNDADPLYVVDGFIVDNIDYLNPNDIENVEIFKDAASSAVYGSRAANGVVSITTKTGKEGKTKITYDGYVGIANPWKTIDVMGLEDYALMQDYISDTKNYSVDGKLYMSKDIDGNYFYDESKAYLLDTIRNNGCKDWWDAITQTGVKHQHGVSVSGGTNKMQYLVSGSYFNEKGFVKTSNYRRFNGRINIKAALAKWLDLSANLGYTNENKTGIPEGSASILKHALYESPMLYMYNNKGYWYSNNPIAVIDRYHNKMSRERLDMNLTLDARLWKYLTYQFRASYYTTPQENNAFTEVQALDEDFDDNARTNVYVRNARTNKWEINNLLTFMWSDKHHNITILAGQTAEGFKYTFHQGDRSGTPSNEDVFQHLSSAYIGDKVYGRPTEWTACGFIGRINYSFNDTYLMQLNVRADGSSMFDKDNRWGIFPSVSLGWKFSNEPFLKKADWLTSGKLRVGWGKLGNNRIDELSRYTYLTSGFNYSYGYGNARTLQGVTATVIGNKDIVWEKNESYNAGVDMSFLDARLMVTVEYFNRKTTDMLLRVPTVSSAGLDASPMTNAGAVKNYGWEYDVKWRDHIGKDWRYEVGFNLSWIKNKVTNLGTGNEPIWGSYLGEPSIVDFVTKTAVGQPIGSFYGYVTDGIFNTWEEVYASAQYEPGKNQSEQTSRPGDFRFKDLNHDGKITAEDRTYLGSPLPKFVFGIPISAGYKNWDLSIFLQGQTGNDVFNVMDYYLYNAASGNVYADIRSKHWSGQDVSGREFFPLNTVGAQIPDLASNDAARNFRASDFFLQDGSYMRLKELRLTYSFPQRLLSKIKVSNLALSITAYNLFTFTGYDGMDPEVGKVVGTESNNLSMGVDQGNYPQARSFIFGVKLGL